MIFYSFFHIFTEHDKKSWPIYDPFYTLPILYSKISSNVLQLTSHQCRRHTVDVCNLCCVKFDHRAQWHKRMCTVSANYSVIYQTRRDVGSLCEFRCTCAVLVLNRNKTSDIFMSKGCVRSLLVLVLEEDYWVEHIIVSFLCLRPKHVSVLLPKVLKSKAPFRDRTCTSDPFAE